MPPPTCTQGRILSSQRDEIACICGGVLVVVARFRAAAVLKLNCPFGDCPLSAALGSAISVDMNSFFSVAGSGKGN
ncbi:hypothetical protein GCM10027598_47870 [Amycolatopsis oliviviridis]